MRAPHTDGPRLMVHCGVAADDPRNAAVIQFFSPKPVTRESLRQRLAAILGDRDPAGLELRIEKTMHTIEHGPIRPNPPLSQPLEAVADPWFGLGTHPDIIEMMWKLDDALPQRCRWVFWGGPSLVHPETGVVFAVGIGTIGLVMRLPPEVLEVTGSDPHHATVVQQLSRGLPFDISSAGPEWRLIGYAAPRAEWCRAAYDFAGEMAG